MPDTLRKDIIDVVWSTIETYLGTRDDLLERMGIENRSRETEAGWLKDFIANAPADFAHVKVTVPRLAHSGWNSVQSLKGEGSAFRNSTTDFVVQRPGRLEITIRYLLAEGDEEEDQHLGDEVVNALFNVGPVLSDDLGLSLGEMVVEDRDTRSDERPYPGKVSTIGADFTCTQMGRALLAAINT